MLATTAEFLHHLNEEKITDIGYGIERLRRLGLTEFALVTNEMTQDKWIHVHKFVPRATDHAIQQSFTGNTGETLLAQSVDFVRHFYGQVIRHLVLPGVAEKFENIRVLDYGCGWGRLLRLMPYYFSYENILGVDPSDEALAECKKVGVVSQGCTVKRDASDLVGRRFEAGYAFSVFTHLPESLTRQTLANIARCFPKNGLLIITIRPPEYWSHRIGTNTDKGTQPTLEKALSAHSSKGFAYLPHEGGIGDFYGDTSMTSDWIEANISDWQIIDTERSLSDPLQIYLTLRRR